MASKPYQRSFGGWFDILKDRKHSSYRGAAVAAPSLLSKVTYSYALMPYNVLQFQKMISRISSFHFYVPPFLLDDEKRMVMAMIDHDMIEDCSKHLTLIRLIRP